MWDLPGPGVEPVSPALAGGLPTTAPPGKSLMFSILNMRAYTHTHTHTHTHSHIHTVGWGETFGGAGYVYYFDCFDSFTDECISPNSSNCVC